MGITGIKEDTDVALLGQCLKLLPLSLDTFSLQTCNECMVLWHTVLNNALFSWARHHFKERLFCDRLCTVIMLEESVQMYWFLSVGEWTYSSVELSYTSEKSLGFTHHWWHHILLNHDPQRVSAHFENCFFWPQQGERSPDKFLLFASKRLKWATDLNANQPTMQL